MLQQLLLVLTLGISIGYLIYKYFIPKKAKPGCGCEQCDAKP